MNGHRLINLTLFLTLTLSMVAQDVYAAPTSTAKATTGVSLDALKKTNDAWVVLKNPIVVQSMQTVMGNQYPLLKDRTQTLNQPETTGDELSSHGGVKGLYLIQESAFSFNMKTHQAQVALLDNGNLNIWGAANQGQLSQPMKNYIANLQSREDGGTLNLIFQAPNQSTIGGVTAKTPKTAVKKNLNLSSPTGTYTRAGKMDEATLKVVKLAGNQIKFGLLAESGGNIGDAEGVIQLTNNKGVYQGDDFQLVFTYSGKSFNIQQTGDGAFGGVNVRPDGVYNKTNDATPTIED